MEKEILAEFGLTSNETKIYMILLKAGGSTIGDIVKNTGFHRRSIYDSLERLIEKGLVGFVIDGKKKYYEVVNPKKFIDIMKEREENFLSIYPKLLKSYKTSKSKQEVIVLRGVEGLKSMFEDWINEKVTVRIFGATGRAQEHLKYYFPGHHKRRLKIGIKLYEIYNQELRGKDITKHELAEIRFLPKEFSSPATVAIYGDNVAIFLYSEEPLAIVIKNKEISQGFKNYFRLLWKIAKK